MILNTNVEHSFKHGLGAKSIIGNLIGANDLTIAAIARANHATLITHNTGEFGRVQGLLIEDWEV